MNVKTISIITILCLTTNLFGCSNTTKEMQKNTGSTLITNTKEEAKKNDTNELNLSKVDIGDLSKLLANFKYNFINWFDNDNLLLYSSNNLNLFLYNIKTKKMEPLECPILKNKNLRINDFNNGLLVLREEIDFKNVALYLYDIKTNTVKFKYQAKEFSNAYFVDNNKYLCVTSSDYIGRGFKNLKDTIIDLDTKKQIVINEDEYFPAPISDKALIEYRPLNRNMFIQYTYSEKTNKFYGALKNKIFEFTFDNPKLNVIKETGDLDILNDNFKAKSDGTGLILEGGKYSGEAFKSYFFDFKTSTLNLLTDKEFNHSVPNINDCFNYNYKKDLIFTEMVDTTNNFVQPVICEIHKNKFNTKSKIPIDKKMEPKISDGYRSFWNPDGTKVLLWGQFQTVNNSSSSFQNFYELIEINS